MIPELNCEKCGGLLYVICEVLVTVPTGKRMVYKSDIRTNATFVSFSPQNLNNVFCPKCNDVPFLQGAA